MKAICKLFFYDSGQLVYYLQSKYIHYEFQFSIMKIIQIVDKKLKVKNLFINFLTLFFLFRLKWYY